MFAIISADGKQYRVAKGDIIRFDRMKSEPGESFETREVLAISEGNNNLKIGVVLSPTEILPLLLSYINVISTFSFQ